MGMSSLVTTTLHLGSTCSTAPSYGVIDVGHGADTQVIYRELRDFLSLHAHYKAANFGTSVGGLRGSRKVDIPEFPKISIPYLKSLRGNQGKDKEKPATKGDYAQASRDALQKYLVELIRAVVSLLPSCEFPYIPLSLVMRPVIAFSGLGATRHYSLVTGSQ